MATTKIIPGVVDLNSATSDKGLKMPSGTEVNRPTDTTGQIRNNTNETSNGSLSSMEYYNGTDWKVITNSCTTNTLDILGDGSCVAAYKFEGNMNDLSGNYNGSATGMTYTTGKFGQAGDFDGSGDYVTISATATTPLDFSTETYSVSHWIYPHNTAEDAIYSSKWSTGATALRSYYIGHNSSGLIRINENPGGLFTSTGTVTQNVWSNVIYVRDATTAYIYINGSLDSTHSRTNTIDQAGTQNIYFGRVEGTASGDMYDGLLDQTRYFNKALSASEVTTVYNEVAC